jgi:transporter family protein
VFLAVTVSVTSFNQEWDRPAAMSARNWTFPLLSGVATGLSVLCCARALQLAVSKVDAVDKLSVGIALVLALWFPGEKPSLRTLIVGVSVFAGSSVMAFCAQRGSSSSS